MEQVISIATGVRQWVEAKAEQANTDESLVGWCARASGELFNRLAEVGITAEIHGNSNHVFVVVDDYIVDVTATQFVQFERTPVVIMHLKEVTTDHWYYHSSWQAKSSTDLRKRQVKEKWPTKQIAYA